MAIKIQAALALAGFVTMSLAANASENAQVMEMPSGVNASVTSSGDTCSKELLAEANADSGKPCQAMEDMDEQENSTEAAGETLLEDTEWILVELNSGPVDMPDGEAMPSLTLVSAGNKATGYTGCNRYFSSYELNDSDLKFGPVGATRKFCEGIQGDIEADFMKALELVRAWKVEDGSLIFTDGNAVLLRFEQSASPSVGGE